MNMTKTVIVVMNIMQLLSFLSVNHRNACWMQSLFPLVSCVGQVMFRSI